MANSYAQTESVTCPICQHTWTASIWLIVDVDERPDLIALARSGTWHSLQCPNCESEFILNTPLLLFWPTSTLPLVFFPAENKSEYADQQDAQILIDTLYERLGSSQWQDAWVDGGITSLSASILPVLLDLPPERTHILRTINQLQKMANWYDVRAFIEKNPALLEDTVDDLYNQIVATVSQDSDSSINDYIADQELLRLCRAEGVAQALFDLTEPLPTNLSEKANTAQEAIEAFAEKGQHDLAALNQAIEILESVQNVPDFSEAGGQSRGIVVQNLGIALLKRYRVSGNVVDLDEAIRYLETAVQITPKAAFVNYAVSQRTLAQALEERYQQTSRGSDLDAAIAAHQAAVSVVQEDASYLPLHLNSYARLLRERYGRNGRLDGLQEAINAWQNVLELVDETAPQTADYLNNLANAYRELYKRNGNDALLREAVALHKYVVDLQPDNADAHNNLANAYMDEFKRFGFAGELDQAIAGYEKAIELPHHQEEEISYHHNLARALYQRAILTEDRDDFIRAWQVLSPIIKQTPEDAPDFPSLLNTLGTILQHVSERSGDETILRGGIAAYQQAAKIGLERKTSLVLNAIAPNWGNWAAERSSWKEADIAYTYGLAASERLYQIQLGRSAKELWLRDAQSLPGLAAYARAKAGDYIGAVMALEQGRSRLLGEALRGDPENLSRLSQSQERPLYEQYVNIIQQINSLETAASQDDGQTMDDLRQLHQQLDEVIDTIQKIPEYANFLRQPLPKEIIASLTTPLNVEENSTIGVYIAVTSLGGLAMLVHAQGIEPVWLDLDSEALEIILRGAFRAEDAQKATDESAALEALITEQLPPEFRLKRVSPILPPESETIAGGYLGGQLGIGELQTAVTQALAVIGEKVIQPIAAKLERIVDPVNTTTPTLILIPTGKLGLLPLHAAPYQADGKQFILLDRYTTLFAPGAESFLVTRRRIQERNSAYSLLFVLDPTETLPFAKMEQEVIITQFDKQTITILAGEMADKQTVIEHVSQQDYLHFACHGFYDWDDVMNSGLLLGNTKEMGETDPLTLQEILLTSFKLNHSRLVVLSACETGLSEFKHMPEEYVGLPAALLQAGAPAVISTLWAVNDLSTALIMERFYQEHITRGLQPGAALRQAQLWLREVSARELADYFAAKRRELGGLSHDISTAWRRFAAMESEERPFAHPYYWAAFTFTGA